MAFDIEGARKSGYTDSEIADYLSQESKFDAAGARSAGYSDSEIIKHLSDFDAKPATALDRTQAGLSGINKAMANVAGLPVDFGLNVLDLLKAPAGIAYSEITGKAVPPALEPFDRSKVPLSSDYLTGLMNKAGIETAPRRPDDTASNILHGAGNIGGSIYFGSAIPGPQAQAPIRIPMRPGSSAQASASATSGVASADNVVQATPSMSARGGYTFGSVGDDAVTGLSKGQQQAAEAGRKMGMRLTPGQATGNKLLQRLEAKLESQPMTAGPFDRVKDANQKTLNRTWSKAIGENTDDLSSDVLANASERIGKVFDDVRDDVQRNIDPAEFVQKMQGLNDEFEAIAPQLWKNPLVARFVSHAESGGATGKDLGNLTSKLGREANKQMTSPNGDRELGQALFQIKDYVDDIVESGLDGARKADYQVARKEYRNLMLLTSRVNTVNPSSGNVNGVSLANLLQTKDKKGFLFGKNKSDAYNAARFAQAFKPIVGDSGTATRMPLNTLEMAMSVPINMAGRVYTSSPAVDLAVRSQAAGQMAGDAARAAGSATGVTSPLGLLFGAQAGNGLLDDYRGR